MEIRNGLNTSFWHDTWSRLGNLRDRLRGRGGIDLGIVDSAKVADVLYNRRRRRHRVEQYNEIEEEINFIRRRIASGEDISLWKQAEGRYESKFSTAKTWCLIREAKTPCAWRKAVWFPQATPKYSFLVWVALRNRLQTGDRMQQWGINIDTSCVLCHDEAVQETCQHLFFTCSYSATVWETLVKGLLENDYTTNWLEVVDMVSRANNKSTRTFLLRYAFQAVVYSIWWERNSRRHGKQPTNESSLIKIIDKTIRLRLLSVKGQRQKYLDEALGVWFGTRGNSGS